jgi:hypothetical protein
MKIQFQNLHGNMLSPMALKIEANMYQDGVMESFSITLDLQKKTKRQTHLIIYL